MKRSTCAFLDDGTSSNCRTVTSGRSTLTGRASRLARAGTLARAALVGVAATLCVGSQPVTAQLIPIRTVPVASGEQFLLLPSQAMGMGGVTLAVDDSLSDGWGNPAMGGRLETDVFLGSPTFYGISDEGGAGRSFPVAGVFSGASWFGGASFAFQQIENSPLAQGWWGSGRSLDAIFGRNVYAGGYAGRRLGTGPWAVGLGLSAGTIEAMDGVDLLYAGAERIDQAGHVADVRIGLDRSGDRDRVGVSLIYGTVSMTHDVTYAEWRWDEVMDRGVIDRRIETNEDRTRTWAGHATWDHDLSAPGWRIGASATVNRKSHPKIPNYSIQDIPRDPGTTWAYEVGFGIAKTENATTFALDVALQPIWSNTWQEANAEDVVASGGALELGDRSIENDFFFTNVMLRSGLSHRFGQVELQMGLEVRSYDYQLDQVDRVEGTFRDQNESWIEWSPTLGGSVALDGLELRYAARVTTGTGQPGIARTFFGPGDQLLGSGSDFILAPGAPLLLQEARVLTHQISIAVPIR